LYTNHSGKQTATRLKRTMLEKLKCPKCGIYTILKDGDSKRAYSFEDCRRVCIDCEIGYSNAKYRPTIIHRNYLDNIPFEVTNDLDFALDNSLNELNKKNKKSKFGYSTSEDAFTWSFFKYFVLKNKLKNLLNLLNIVTSESTYNLYLWGAKINTNSQSTYLKDQFIEFSDLLGESPRHRTEPDVIIELDDQLIFIEVKYLSKNEICNDKSKFLKYKVSNIDSKAMSESGHYELFRNWAFVSHLSKGKKFSLINLGLKKLFKDNNREALAKFEGILKSSNGQFVKLTWQDIFEKIKNNSQEYDTWFIDYLEKKLTASR